MKISVRAAKQNQGPSNIDKLVTPEMRQRTRELKRNLVQCGHPLLDHLGSVDTIVEAFGTAQQSAKCLLADDPFEAWEKVIEEDKGDELDDTTKKQEAKTTAVYNVKRMITRPMREQLVEAIKRLDEYHGCLTGFLDDLSKLESFHTASRLAEDLQRDRPLETAEARKKRKEAETEAEAEAEAEDDLDGL